MYTPQSPYSTLGRRRKLRKDTHSCWECKRRKMKCVYEASDESSACNGCRRRGSSCVPQDAHDHTPFAKTNPITPSSIVSASPRQTVSASPTTVSLSRTMYDALPSRDDIERIYAAIPDQHAMPYEMMTMPYTSLSQEPGANPPERQTPIPDAHPVLIARHMLFIASILQHLHPDVHPSIRDLSEPPADMAARLAELAISSVTSKDEPLGSIEGLICVLMESVYHANLGNLRRSWIAARRAITIGQLMGLDRRHALVQFEELDPSTRHDPRTIWSRIVFQDRFLCLLLGLPQACNVQTLDLQAPLDDEPPLQRLERVHHMVVSAVIERNTQTSPSQDIATTTFLDTELQRAARTLPSKWWLVPDLQPPPSTSASLSPSSSTIHSTARLYAQILHYNLLNHLHLPSLLHTSQTQNHPTSYALITCTTSSREILLRFLALRAFNGIAPSCRIIDFIALMAAMTLLLAHLDGAHRGEGNLLAQQWCSDRAVVERVRERYGEAGGEGLSASPVSAEAADLLGRLLAVDVDVFARSRGRVSLRRVDDVAEERDDADGVVRVRIPYFGVIQIARQQPPVRMPTSSHTMDVPPAPSTDINDFGTINAQPMNDLPGLAAGVNDWAFQGVDLAYLDNLMMYQGLNDT